MAATVAKNRILGVLDKYLGFQCHARRAGYLFTEFLSGHEQTIWSIGSGNFYCQNTDTSTRIKKEIDRENGQKMTEAYLNSSSSYDRRET